MLSLFLYRITPSLHITRPYPMQCPWTASEPSHQLAISRSVQSFYLHTYPLCHSAATQCWMLCHAGRKGTAEAVSLKYGKRAGSKWWEKNAALDDGSPPWPGWPPPIAALLCSTRKTISSSQGKGCRSIQAPARKEKKVLWKQWMCGAGQVKYMRRGRRGQAWRGYIATEGVGLGWEQMANVESSLDRTLGAQQYLVWCQKELGCKVVIVLGISDCGLFLPHFLANLRLTNYYFQYLTGTTIFLQF